MIKIKIGQTWKNPDWTVSILSEYDKYVWLIEEFCHTYPLDLKKRKSLSKISLDAWIFATGAKLVRANYYVNNIWAKLNE